MIFTALLAPLLVTLTANAPMVQDTPKAPELLTLLNAFAPTTRAQEPTPEGATAAQLDCPTCAGKGRAAGDCWVCRGEGEHACAVCAKFAAKPPSRVSLEWMSPAALQLMKDNLLELLKDLAMPDFHLPGTPKPPKSVKLLPGDRACPSRCTGGKMLLIDDWIDCKTCGNGKFSCAFCSRGVVSCEPCKSTGKAVNACDDCAGTGRIPDSAALAATVCPWCTGANERACGSCKNTAETAPFCPTCYGVSEVACGSCQGFGVCPCTKCVGRGRTGPRKEKCDTCAGRGAWNCRDCKKGRSSCSDCVGGPRVRACVDCNDSGMHTCNGCSVGAYVAWERTASLERARGNDTRALGLLQVARARCVARYAAVIGKLDQMTDKALAKELDAVIAKERDAELRRIDAAIAAGTVPEKGADKDVPKAR